MQLNPIQLILHADIVVKGVIVLLLFMYIISWAIIIQKILLFKKIFQNSLKFETFFQGQNKVENIVQASQKATLNPLANLFLDAYQGAKRLSVGKPTPEFIEKLLQKSKENELATMESRISFLATTGSSAPFIGLFGTVWGIMNSFLSIGAKGATSLAVVAPGIAEALIATALGLVAAIPAVIGYNYSV